MIESEVKTEDGTEPIKAYSWDEYKFPVLHFRKVQKNHKFIRYATDYFCLDTETSHTDGVTGWIYQWAICIKQKGFVYGRKPSELIDFMIRCAEHYKLNEAKRIIVYIHNASYDFAYLKKYLMKYDPLIDVLAIDNHTVLTVDVLGFRFICSYKLTNLSLAVLSDKYATKYRKASGEIDYQIIRYQDSELNPDDWRYMFSDVASQYDGIFNYLKMNDYTFAAEAPFTSTGFVRAVCRSEARHTRGWHEQFQIAALDLPEYRLCRQGFMGGLTIANFNFTGKTITSDKLRHKDFTSSYPARQCIDYMPEGKPMQYGNVSDKEELKHLIKKYCCVFVLTLEDVHIRPGVTAPYIPSSKCLGADGILKINGKVVFAKRLSIVVTEIDYKWICKQYTASSQKITNMITFKRGKMPDWMIKTIMTYFKNKCELKHTDPVLYAKSKNILNGIYGNTATAILREQYRIGKDDGIISKLIEEDKDAEDLKRLQKYYRSYNNYLEYQWALYTTAHARDALMTMIECVGYENFIYCDTDSVFYIETPENAKNMQKYQLYCKERAISAGAYVGENYLGMPTDEPPLTQIRTLHAKCYAITEEGKLNVIIAGIPKKATKWIDGKAVTMTNADELGCIDNLEDGFTFRHCGGTRCIYNDERPMEVRDINGHMTELATSAVIENIEKELSDTMWTSGANYELVTNIQVTD